MSKVFVDTNILAYALDLSDKKRQKKCRESLKQLVTENNGVLSTQVLQEFYVVATKKLGVEPLQAKGLLHSFENYELVTVTSSHIKEAIDCSVINQISFWDALIVVAAESAKCEKIWTEDLNHGQIINGVQIENIFKAS